MDGKGREEGKRSCFLGTAQLRSKALSAGPFRLLTKNTIYRLDVHRTTDVRRRPPLTYREAESRIMMGREALKICLHMK